MTGPRSFNVPCTIKVQNTFESLHAHVELANGVVVHPGDEVCVQGSPIRVPYGESATFERIATVRRASWLERAWTRLTGRTEFMELLEFSFSERTHL